ncbi:MAG: hypothetical protein COV76_01900 [Candidatus Omnitrophica bacterium CG11_big_fil_rev_8_21_14_0_20_64_10]|nr:MAG: hypothetical protein COV76_01900 [Candidatus Omnitrophica bacterium CG11_big_fil_rev_8_21_14_0_20_64_10]
MSPTRELLEKLEGICRQEPRYKPEAYLFLLAALHHTVSRLPKRRHISGQELLTGIREYGLDQFGGLTVEVFTHWGVETTEDFGRIVFALVEAGLLGKTEEDSLADFQDVYQFETAFDPAPLYRIKSGRSVPARRQGSKEV